MDAILEWPPYTDHIFLAGPSFKANFLACPPPQSHQPPAPLTPLPHKKWTVPYTSQVWATILVTRGFFAFSYGGEKAIAAVEVSQKKKTLGFLASFRHFEDLWGGSLSRISAPISQESHFPKFLHVHRFPESVFFFFPKQILIANFFCLFTFFALTVSIDNYCIKLNTVNTVFILWFVLAWLNLFFRQLFSFLPLERRRDFADFPTDRRKVTTSRAQILVNPTFRRTVKSWNPSRYFSFSQIPDGISVKSRILKIRRSHFQPFCERAFLAPWLGQRWQPYP